MMSAAKYPYETRLDILHQQLEVMDIQKFAETIDFRWFNQTLCKVNDSVVRVGVIEGEYHWHKHDRDDEFFYVISGRLLIDLEERAIDLSSGQAFVVPRGVVHRTRAPERTIILMVENAKVIPTGDT